MTSTPTTPLPPRPGEPTDLELRERYRNDAAEQREQRRTAAGRAAAEVPPSRTPRGPILVLAGLVSLVLVLLAGMSLIGPMLKQTETTEQALPAASAVRIEGEVGAVRVRAAEPGERPKVVMTSEWGLRRPTTTVRESDGTARLTSRCPSWGPGTVCSVDWLVVVPPASDLTIEHGVGDIQVEGLSGDVDVEAGVADVTIAQSTGEDASIHLGVGAIDYEATEPPREVDLSVGVGEARVRVPDTVPYRVTTQGGASDITNTIGSDPTAERRIRVESGVGAIMIDPS
jgi:hypothetical protein